MATPSRASRVTAAAAGADLDVAGTLWVGGAASRVAVPLRTRQGQTVAALNVVLAPGRLNDAALAGEILPRLREAAGEIRQLL